MSRPQAPEAFERVRRLVEPHMQAAIDRLGPELRLPARYHLGWVDRAGRPTSARGKGLRSTLAVVGAEAAGVAPGDAVPAAVAVELVHEFSLVHDDLIDGDVERRHRPALWHAFSTGEAVIVGDGMANLAMLVLLEVARPRAGAAAVLLARASAAMIEGQSRDLALARSGPVSVEDCSSMEQQKTAALLGCAASIGALLGGAEGSAVQALETFGTELGLAFQAVDDLLGIWGDPTVTGKPTGNDLREGKSSMPVALAHRLAPDRSEELAQMLGAPLVDDASVARAAGLIEASGARDATERLAADHLAAALAVLGSESTLARDPDDLETIARFAAHRAY